MTEAHLDSLTTIEAKRGQFDKAIIPLGSCEVHGDHLPYGSDTFIAGEIAERVAKRVNGVLIVPAVPYGMSWHHADLPFTVSLSPETLAQVIREVAGGLIKHGIARIVMVTGHDGNIGPMEMAARHVKHDTGVTLAALPDWWFTSARLLPREMFHDPGGLGHGGEGETSLNLAINPELVKLENIDGAPVYDALELPDLQGPTIRMFRNFGDHSPVGFCGNAHHATAEKGEAMLNACVDLIVRHFEKTDREGWK
jgi:creatinine amidohydrolase